MTVVVAGEPPPESFPPFCTSSGSISIDQRLGVADCLRDTLVGWITSKNEQSPATIGQIINALRAMGNRRLEDKVIKMISDLQNQMEK